MRDSKLFPYNDCAFFLIQEEDVRDVLRTEFPEGLDLVYEGVGGDMLGCAIEHLAENGVIVVVGYISGYPHVKVRSNQFCMRLVQLPGHPIVRAYAGSDVHEDASDPLRTLAPRESIFPHLLPSDPPRMQRDDADSRCDESPAAASELDPRKNPFGAEIGEEEIFWGRKVLEGTGGRRIIGDVYHCSAEDRERCKDRIFELFRQGKLQAWIDGAKFVGVDSITAAVEWMLSGNSTGKVVVRLN